MKKKHLNIPLFILVLIIYGGVFLKFFGKKEVQLNDSPYNAGLSKQVSNFDIKRNDFDISNIKSDPFGISKKRKKRPAVNAQSRSNSASKIQKTQTVAIWPKIIYYGFVKNNVNTTRLALVKVDDKLYRKREKERIKTLQIQKVFNDSITLKFNNEVKTIKKIND